ncbi:MAG: GntR family transcriptional regulator [Lachnospiraceae bacterium]
MRNELLDISKDTPLYKQLSEILYRKIETGEWEYNQKIPTEPELCELYKISRQTVRLAIEDLKNKGYVCKKQGLGTFVTHPKVEEKIFSFRFYDNEENASKQVKEILKFEIIEADGHVGEKLMLKKGSRVFLIHRLFYNDGIPTTVTDSYIPFELCPGLTEKQVREQGLYHTLEGFGLKLDKGTRLFEAVVIDGENRRLLGTAKNTAGFHIQRVTCSKTIPVEFADSYMRGDMMQFSITLNQP